VTPARRSNSPQVAGSKRELKDDQVVAVARKACYKELSTAFGAGRPNRRYHGDRWWPAKELSGSRAGFSDKKDVNADHEDHYFCSRSARAEPDAGHGCLRTVVEDWLQQPGGSGSERGRGRHRPASSHQHLGRWRWRGQPSVHRPGCCTPGGCGRSARVRGTRHASPDAFAGLSIGVPKVSAQGAERMRDPAREVPRRGRSK
jgi:hypothetical protein